MSRTIKNQYSNAGVHGSTGYEFQKHCALYILLSEYTELEDKEYCIFFEQADDFVYYFFNDKLVEEVRAYQAKKSGKTWTSTEINKILVKMCQSGAIIKQDNSYNRSSEYRQSETFITNQPIHLKNQFINVDNDILKIKDASKNDCEDIKNVIIDDVKKALFDARKECGEVPNNITFQNWYSQLKEDEKNVFDKEVEDDPVTKEFDNLHIQFIDLPQKQNSQREQLIGKLTILFKDKIHDMQAAIDTLLSLFTQSAATFNQDGEITFDNKDKQIKSSEIDSCFSTLTTESKAFKIWHEKASELCPQLKIPINQKNIFEQELHNSFDYFKDTTKIEHQKILELGKAMYESGAYYSEQDLANAMFAQYKSRHQSRLSDTAIKAICFAAAVQYQN